MSAESEDLNAIVRGARAEFRERQIVDAAVRLMQEKGTHSVSMQAIAKSCGVSVGLLYKYFSDKEQIVLAAITRVLEDGLACATVATIAAVSPIMLNPRRMSGMRREVFLPRPVTPGSR